jgi:hypothetical protein
VTDLAFYDPCCVKLPKLTRKRGPKGKFTGSYLVKVNGRQVNLRTTILDGPDGAIERSKQAKAGRTEFRSDADLAAELLETVPPPAPTLVPPSPASPMGVVPPAPPAAPAAPPVAPDSVLPPPRPLLAAVPDDAAAEAAATSAAAAETAGSSEQDAGGAADAPPMDPDVLEQFLTQGAEVIVDAQLAIQAAIIKKRTGKIAAPVPPESKLRSMAAAAWVAQLKIWFPVDVMLPPWVMAIALPLMAMPAQAAGATDPPADGAGADIPAAA